MRSCRFCLLLLGLACLAAASLPGPARLFAQTGIFAVEPADPNAGYADDKESAPPTPTVGPGSAATPWKMSTADLPCGPCGESLMWEQHAGKWVDFTAFVCRLGLGTDYRPAVDQPFLTLTERTDPNDSSLWTSFSLLQLHCTFRTGTPWEAINTGVNVTVRGRVCRANNQTYLDDCTLIAAAGKPPQRYSLAGFLAVAASMPAEVDEKMSLVHGQFGLRRDYTAKAVPVLMDEAGNCLTLYGFGENRFKDLHPGDEVTLLAYYRSAHYRSAGRHRLLVQGVLLP